MEMKDITALFFSAVSIVISIYTFWLVQFNRGRLMMTRPTYLCLSRDAGPNWPKIFIRTCLYSTGSKGLAIENIYLRVYQKGGAVFIFDYWGHTDGGGRLTIGSGLYVGPTGVSNDHHFNFRGEPSLFLPMTGGYRIEVYATIVGNDPIRISEIEFEINGKQSAEMVQIPNRKLEFYWNATQEKYLGEIRRQNSVPDRSSSAS